MFSFLSTMNVSQWVMVSINSVITLLFFSLYWRTFWGRRATFAGLIFFPGLFFLLRFSFLVYVLSGVEWLSIASVSEYLMTLSGFLLLISGLAYGLLRQNRPVLCDVKTWSLGAMSCQLSPSPLIGLTLMTPVVIEVLLNLQQVLWGIAFQPTSNCILAFKWIEVAVGFCLGILMGDSLYYVRDLLRARREV